jgi:transcriptional regulator with XRE-family HTH domain
MTQADQLRDYLARLGLSQRAAAKALGIDDRTMRYWCAGTREIPSIVFMALEGLTKLRNQLPELYMVN